MKWKILIGLLLSTSTFFPQTPRIKKCTQITFDYSFIHFGGQVAIDTTITVYDSLGNVLLENNRKPNYSFVTIVKQQTLDSNNFKVIKSFLRSDSSVLTLTRYNYKDSVVYFESKGADTLEVWKTYFRHGRVIRTSRLFFHDKEYSFSENIRINPFRKKREETSVDWNNVVEKKRFVINRIFDIHKEYDYNDSTKEWFLKAKVRYNRAGQRIKEVNQFYHEFHKRYYKTFVRYKYDKFGHLVSMRTKDHLRTLEKATVYLYEYY